MKKTPVFFTYLNHKFEPLGKLPENFNFFEVTRKCRSIGISNYNSSEYPHREFYRKAANCGLNKVDVFLMDDELLVLPCENELFECSGRFENVSEISRKD